MEGNTSFAEHRMVLLQEDLGLLRLGTVAKQEPFAAVLACADSRVPAEMILDQTICRIFVAQRRRQYRQAGSDLDAVICANARLQARLLRDALPVIGDGVRRGEVSVSTGYHDLASGRVTLMEIVRFIGNAASNRANLRPNNPRPHATRHR